MKDTTMLQAIFFAHLPRLRFSNRSHRYVEEPQRVGRTGPRRHRDLFSRCRARCPLPSTGGPTPC